MLLPTIDLASRCVVGADRFATGWRPVMRRVVFSAAAPGWCRAALLCCGIGAGMSLSDLAHAAPPQQLVGKSVVVTWNESRIQRTVGQAEFRSVQASHVMSLYVGESGRVFSRLTNTTRAGSGS